MVMVEAFIDFVTSNIGISIITALITSLITIGLTEIIKYRSSLGVIGHKKKLELYSVAIAPFTNYLGKVSRNARGLANNEITVDDFNELDRLRLELHGRLGLFASNAVMRAYDSMCDGMRDYNEVMLVDKEKLDEDEIISAWNSFTALALKWVSEMRKNIGIRKDEVIYTGKYN